MFTLKNLVRCGGVLDGGVAVASLELFSFNRFIFVYTVFSDKGLDGDDLYHLEPILCF